MKYKSAAINYLLLGLIGFSIFALAVGYFQIRGSIYKPFVRPKKMARIDQATVIARLQEQDTDEDGLSDFDESYIHGTSIYLPDSDSDGFSDKEEIEAKSNPLNALSTPYNKIVAESNLEEQIVSLDTQSSKSGGPLSASAQEIRDLLVNQGGLDREAVDKIDDKTLLELYNETKAETGIGLEEISQLRNIASLSPNQGEEKIDENLQQILENLENMTPQEIRQLLILNGMDEKLLNQFDDEMLKKIFLEAIKENLK